LLTWSVTRSLAGIAAMLTSVIGVLADLGYLGWDLAAARRAANRIGRVLNSPGHVLISDVRG
jgi:hypothetical protein